MVKISEKFVDDIIAKKSLEIHEKKAHDHEYEMNESAEHYIKPLQEGILKNHKIEDVFDPYRDGIEQNNNGPEEDVAAVPQKPVEKH